MLFTGILTDLLEWYQNTVIIGFTRFPYLFISMILTYVIIQLFCLLIPPLKRVLITLALPFRYMHVWLHVDAAKKATKRNSKQKKKDQVVINLWTRLKGNDSAYISLKAYSTRDAIKIASAPLKGALALLSFIVLSSPILAKLGLLGLLIHIYLIFSCFGVALPSISDYSFIYQGIMIHPDSFSPGYILWVYFIFAISGYIALNRTGSPISAIADGLLFSGFYLVGLLLLAKFVTLRHSRSMKKPYFFNSNI